MEKKEMELKPCPFCGSPVWFNHNKADSFIEAGGIRAAVFVDTPDGLKPTYTRSRNAEDLPAVKEV